MLLKHNFVAHHFLPVTMGTFIPMVSSLLKVVNLGERVSAMSISACSKWECFLAREGKEGLREKGIQAQSENSAMEKMVLLRGSVWFPLHLNGG